MLAINKLVASLIVVIFIIVVFVMVIFVLVFFVMFFFVLVVFVIVHCRNMHNIAPHGATAAEDLISSPDVVQEGSPKQ